MGWRRALLESVGHVAVTVPTTLGLPLTNLLPSETGARTATWLFHAWGRTMLQIARVDVEVEHAERLAAPAPRVVLFNHASLLDAFVVTMLMPPHSTAVVKKELLSWPFVGWAIKRIGFVVLDRGNSVSARARLHDEVARIQREQLSVFVAPEGTRTRTGDLLPFKRGAFHLALEARVPVVPVVIEGAFRLRPRGRFETRPGRLRVRVMPAQEPTWTAETAGAAADRLHAQYAAWLAERWPEAP